MPSHIAIVDVSQRIVRVSLICIPDITFPAADVGVYEIYIAATAKKTTEC